MIVISAGLPRSGSAWLFNLTNDLLVAAGGRDVRAVRDERRLGDILRPNNCLLNDLRLPTLLRLRRAARGSVGIVVKTHTGTSRLVERLLSLGAIKATYIARDPRDSALSAYREGVRGRAEGKTNAFTRLPDLESSILATQDWLRAGVGWRRHPQVLRVAYEELALETTGTLRRVAGHLGLPVPESTLAAIVSRYDAGSATPGAKAVAHLRDGRIGSAQAGMTQVELDACRHLLETHLRELGYWNPA